MNRGTREKELQLELTELRNPYLQRKRPASRKRKKHLFRRAFRTVVGLAVAVGLFYLTLHLFMKPDANRDGGVWKAGAHIGEVSVEKPDWTVDYLTPNEYSRPGEAIGTVTNIFVHYTANPGTSAAQNRSYFEQLKDTHERSASAHFIIGYEGEIIQCVPLSEIAYAVQTRNYDSVSIECCYKSTDGAFTKETQESLTALLAYLLDYYDLSEEDILRHYDCGGKKCPLYYVEHEDAWEELKEKVAEALQDEIL